MNDRLKLKDYLNLNLISSYKKLSDESLSVQERTNEIIKVQVLEEVDRICQSRRRY